MASPSTWNKTQSPSQGSPPGACRAVSASLLPLSLLPYSLWAHHQLPGCSSNLPTPSHLSALAEVTAAWSFLSQSGFLSDWIQVSAVISPPLSVISDHSLKTSLQSPSLHSLSFFLSLFFIFSFALVII